MNKLQSKSFKFIDLFCGIGGFRIAFDRLGGECVFSSDNDLECQKTYESNFGELPSGDITKINPTDIPDHDILCGGFPCQPFSVSGKQKGFEDTRGTLFFNVLEIIKEKQPKVVFLENVKQLKYHDDGNTLKVILNSLNEIGYKAEWKVLNAKDFGLSQNRERIVIIASKSTNFNFDLLQFSDSIKIRDILEINGDFQILEKNQYTIIDKTHWKTQTTGLIFCGYRNKSIRVAGVRPNTEHLSRVHKQPNRIYHTNGTHPTIPSQEVSGRFWIYDDSLVRKLTVLECFRLQGFPDNYKKISSNGNLYRQIGNSVAIPMIYAVGKQILTQYFEPFIPNTIIKTIKKTAKIKRTVKQSELIY
jgi:DNA (cytosine-5)-methyltransferase 1